MTEADVRMREYDRLLASAMSQLADQRTEINRLRELLGRLEWTASWFDDLGQEWPGCPMCVRSQAEGHESDCPLAAALEPSR
jgi:hypothetical protein